jgi:UPF0755 protein
VSLIRRLLAVGLVVVVLGGAAGGYLAFRRPAPGPEVEVVVASGLTTLQIADQLTEADVIGSVLGFRVMSRARGLDGKIAAGRYELRRGMGVHAALDVLAEGPVERAVSLTIPEGYALDQIAARVGDRTQINQEAFSKAAASGAVRSQIQPPAVRILEGLLFPDTYVVGEREEAEGLLRRMVSVMDERIASLDWSALEARGLSRYEGIIVASLVEREARVPEDRAKVAAVIYNRLAKGMKLQIDITALYGTDHKVPTRRDLERESPYNTYLIEGLPPTPIASPGMDALRAAAEPASIDALYYVVVDPSGRHAFTASYAEFQRLLSRRPPEVRGG